VVENVALTKATSFPPDIFARETSEDCVLSSESLSVPRRQLERVYDLF
jgi:hypothetical protein